ALHRSGPIQSISARTCSTVVRYNSTRRHSGGRISQTQVASLTRGGSVDRWSNGGPTRYLIEERTIPDTNRISMLKHLRNMRSKLLPIHKGTSAASQVKDAISLPFWTNLGVPECYPGLVEHYLIIRCAAYSNAHRTQNRSPQATI